MSDGLAALLETVQPCAAGDKNCSVRGKSCKKDEYEWIPRTELDQMKSHITVRNTNQTTEKKNSDIQLEQDNSKNNPMTYAKRIDHCNFINIEKIRSIQVTKTIIIILKFQLIFMRYARCIAVSHP